MTTDYSAMTNAELLAAWDAARQEGRAIARATIKEVAIMEAIWQRCDSMVELRFMADLDAARAEAQRLREQRDACLDMLRRLAAWYQPVTTMSGAGFPVFIEDVRALLGTIAAEDGAQGGED